MIDHLPWTDEDERAWRIANERAYRAIEEEALRRELDERAAYNRLMEPGR